MRDRLWRMRRMPQRSHYLDWCEKIKEKYSSKGEYGFAGATLTFLQHHKTAEYDRPPGDKNKTSGSHGKP